MDSNIKESIDRMHPKRKSHWKKAYINVACVVLARPLTCENCNRMDENVATNDKTYGQFLYCIQQNTQYKKVTKKLLYSITFAEMKSALWNTLYIKEHRQ